MVQFDDWCDVTQLSVGEHRIDIITGKAINLDAGVEATANCIPSHYTSEQRIARALTRLGKPAAAKLIEESLPTSKQIRSGDIGEIYATEWISAHSVYQVPIKRLRWKDHRNMAMRGDDVIGIQENPETGKLRFLKAEAKSRVRLTTQVINEARAGLDKDDGRPSAHSLSFLSARLLELGDEALSDAIDQTLLTHGVPANSVTHLLFTFSGNAPSTLLTSAFTSYTGEITQWGVGVNINDHADFVRAVYDRVISNANDG